MYLNTLRHRLQSSTELQLGVIGPASGAQEAQSFVHWSWSPSSAKPRGWDNQLGNAVQIGLVNTYQYRPAKFEWCRTKFGCNGAYAENRIIDLTPRFEGVLGTHMVRATGGAILRVGYRFPDAVGIAIDRQSFVHAPGSGGVVRVDQLSSPYWKDRLRGIRRVSAARE